MTTKAIPPFGKVSVSVPAGGSIAVFTRGQVVAYQVQGFVNQPSQTSRYGSISNGVGTFGSFTNATTVYLEADGQSALYEVGSGPVVKDLLDSQYQVTPATLDATGTLTVAKVLTGIVTSSTAAAVTGTLDTGTLFDAATSWDIGDAVDWSVINTGGTNAFTVAAATGHTIVGSATVAASTSAHFRTRKTAANTFVTYRMS